MPINERTTPPRRAVALRGGAENAVRTAPRGKTGMSAKAKFSSALILAAFGGWMTAAAQPPNPAPPPEAPQPPATAPSAIPDVLPNAGTVAPTNTTLPPGPNGYPAGTV